MGLLHCYTQDDKSVRAIASKFVQFCEGSISAGGHSALRWCSIPLFSVAIGSLVPRLHSPAFLAHGARKAGEWSLGTRLAIGRGFVSYGVGGPAQQILDSDN